MNRSYYGTEKEDQNRQIDNLLICAENLKRLWEQSFGTNFIKTIKAIKCQIRKTLEDYVKFMRRHSTRSNRERIKLLRKENSTLFYCFTPSFNPADFDKYKNYELEKKFYEGHINQRVLFVSEEIDEEYEEDRSLRIVQLQNAENSFQMEMPFIFDKNEEVISNQDNLQAASESALNSTVSRSGLIRQTKSINSMGSQVDFCHNSQPPVRKVKLCTEQMKTALAEISVRVQTSPGKAHKAAQAFLWQHFYGHNYYLLCKEKYTLNIR